MAFSSCPAGTCDGCTFYFLWESAAACPRCAAADFHQIEGACRGGVQVTPSDVPPHPSHLQVVLLVPPFWKGRRFLTSSCSSPQETLYMWNEPKLCTRGVPLPPRSSAPCEAVALWLKVGVGGGAFVAVLLIALTCYFWKKNKRFGLKMT